MRSRRCGTGIPARYGTALIHSQRIWSTGMKPVAAVCEGLLVPGTVGGGNDMKFVWAIRSTRTSRI